MTARGIRLGCGQVVSLASYVRVVKLAKANPARRFNRDLIDRWPALGADIVAQFRRGMVDRINQAIPYLKRGSL